MKKIITTIILLILAVFVIFNFVKNKKVVPLPEQITQLSGRQCFAYNQTSTETAPYDVEELIDINIAGLDVQGTKNGKQSGPDMTNGYVGSLLGTIKGDVLTTVYSYTVEGSANKEQEEYKIINDGLLKQRYPLKEQGGMLVPNKKEKLVAEMLYIPITCVDIPVEKEETTAGLGQKILNNDLYITPVEVLSDSRCAVDVQCIWAGTVNLRTKLESGTESNILNLTLGTPVVFGEKRVTLTEVSPSKESQKNISTSQYKFKFLVE